ncbi:MAG: hypothetical protein ACI8UZ_003152 [Akkermansiaceae bacterium]|jgi:hypothetical protein
MSQRRFPAILLLLFLLSPLSAEEKEKQADPLAALKLPGVTINLKKRSVDIKATISLDEGSLEFVACLKDTKEHESIITIQAKPSHIHTALLLLGAEAGNPAMRKLVGEGDDQHWIDLPPKGSPITVSFVTTDKAGRQTERPLSDFIVKADESATKFPHNTFLFAGSHLTGKDDGPKTYLADRSGSVISISTFGDELLCLPLIYGQENHALQWEINPTNLPAVGSEIILRLHPQIKKNPKKL